MDEKGQQQQQQQQSASARSLAGSTLSRVASTPAVKSSSDLAEGRAAPATDSKRKEAEEAWRSECRTEGADPARCQRRIKELIGKHEIKNEELERREGHLHRRLQMLECSMPAVMAWKAWRTQSSPEAVRELVAEAAAEATNACRITPSRHYDCRVREIEAQRKKAQQRAEEARSLWLEREAALQGQKARLELARQRQAERLERVDKLADEARKLEEEQRAEIGPASGEGGNKSKWLELVDSAASLRSCDLECLGRLESLAEAESCMRRCIGELEAKEEAYMRALARADELCARAEAPATELERARAEADEMRKQLEACQAELERYREVEASKASVEPTPITDDKDATQDKSKELKDAQAGGDYDLATVRDKASEAGVRVDSKETWVSVESQSKEITAAVSCVSSCVGSYLSQANKSVHASADTRDNTTLAYPAYWDKSSEAFIPDASDTNCYCGSTCGDGDEQDNEEFSTCCPPDFICTDVVTSPTGMMDEVETATDTCGLPSCSKLGPRATDSDKEKQRLPPASASSSCSRYSTASEQCLCDERMKIGRTEIEMCLSIINDIHKKISAASNFPLLSGGFTNLKGILTNALGLGSSALSAQPGVRSISHETVTTTESRGILSTSTTVSKTESKGKLSSRKSCRSRSATSMTSKIKPMEVLPNESKSKEDVKSLKSILKSQSVSLGGGKRSVATQPSRTDCESKKTVKTVETKSKATLYTGATSQKSETKDENLPISQKVSQKFVTENESKKSIKSISKSKAPSEMSMSKSSGLPSHKSSFRFKEEKSQSSIDPSSTTRKFQKEIEKETGGVNYDSTDQVSTAAESKKGLQQQESTKTDTNFTTQSATTIGIFSDLEQSRHNLDVSSIDQLSSIVKSQKEPKQTSTETESSTGARSTKELERHITNVGSQSINRLITRGESTKELERQCAKTASQSIDQSSTGARSETNIDRQSTKTDGRSINQSSTPARSQKDVERQSAKTTYRSVDQSSTGARSTKEFDRQSTNVDPRSTNRSLTPGGSNKELERQSVKTTCRSIDQSSTGARSTKELDRQSINVGPRSINRALTPGCSNKELERQSVKTTCRSIESSSGPRSTKDLNRQSTKIDGRFINQSSTPAGSQKDVGRQSAKTSCRSVDQSSIGAKIKKELDRQSTNVGPRSVNRSLTPDGSNKEIERQSTKTSFRSTKRSSTVSSSKNDQARQSPKSKRQSVDRSSTGDKSKRDLEQESIATNRRLSDRSSSTTRESRKEIKKSAEKVAEEKKILNQASSVKTVTEPPAPEKSFADERRESDVKRDSELAETEVRAIELGREQPTVPRVETDVEEEADSLPLPFVIEIPTERSERATCGCDLLPACPARKESSEEGSLRRILDALSTAQEKEEVLPRDKPDLSAKGRDKTEERDLCICEPLTRIMGKWQRQREKPVRTFSRLPCGCVCERRAPQSSERRVVRCARHRRKRRWRHAASICPSPPRLPAKEVVVEEEEEEERCHRCGGPMRRGSASGEPEEGCDGENCSRKSECMRLGEVESHAEKRDQAVLAKLPRTESRRKRKKRQQRPLEILFDGASRKAARFLETITGGGGVRMRKQPGSSCTCVKNDCRCGQKA